MLSQRKTSPEQAYLITFLLLVVFIYSWIILKIFKKVKHRSLALIRICHIYTRNLPKTLGFVSIELILKPV